jgi:hypothetical protein
MLVAVFCIAVAVGLFAALASFSDVWFHRTDPAGRGLALAYGWLLLPFPVLALLLFLLGRSHAFRVAGLAVACLPGAATLLLMLASAVGIGKPREPNLDRPELVVAAREPSLEPKLRALLKAGTSPDTVLPDDIGQPTALVFHAMNTNARPNIKAVVEAGAKLDVRDQNGDTPLGRALVHRLWDVALVMVEHGAPLTGTQASSGKTLEVLAPDLVPPQPGTPERAEFDRVVEAIRAKGVVLDVKERTP